MLIKLIKIQYKFVIESSQLYEMFFPSFKEKIFIFPSKFWLIMKELLIDVPSK